MLFTWVSSEWCMAQCPIWRTVLLELEFNLDLMYLGRSVLALHYVSSIPWKDYVMWRKRQSIAESVSPNVVKRFGEHHGYVKDTHCSDVTWASWRFKSPTTGLLIQHSLALCEWNPPVIDGFSLQKANNARSVFIYDVIMRCGVINDEAYALGKHRKFEIFWIRRCYLQGRRTLYREYLAKTRSHEI